MSAKTPPAFLRSKRVPLSLRRAFAKRLVPYSDDTFTITLNGVSYSGILDNYIDWVVYVTGDFFEYTYLNFISALGLNGCAIDVGANVGNHSLYFSTLFDEVHSVEPYKPVYDRLIKKVQARSNVFCHNLALSDSVGELKFAPPQGKNLGTGRIDIEGSFSVPVVTGDSYLEGKLRSKVALIKVDVEGHEMPVLRGLQKTISSQRPFVIYEMCNRTTQDTRSDLIESFELFPKDYLFAAFKGQSTYPVQRTVARCIPLNASNFRQKITYVLAYPQEGAVRLEGLVKE